MRRILVVDDDPQTRAAIGCGSSTAASGSRSRMAGASGLAALKDATFDLMIVDVFMPNMRGFEAIRIFTSMRRPCR